MSGQYITRLAAPSTETAGEHVSGWVGSGTPTHHLHSEWQFAVPGADTGLSLGAFHRFPVRPCDLTVIPPFAVHTEAEIAIAEDWQILYVSPRVIARLRRPVPERTGPPSAFTSPVLLDPELALELRELLRQGASDQLAGSEFPRQVRGWLERLLERHGSVVGSVTPRNAVERAKAFLDKQPGRALPLRETAAAAGTSVGQLTRKFARTVGLAPQRYHTQVRLAHARTLLSEGHPASRVTYECGFADQSHLNRCFKARYGITPGAFQAQAGQLAIPVPLDPELESVGSSCEG